jgi:DNA adenine methylase
MAFNHSPLRYPGGKSSIYATVRDVINASDLRYCTYAEPFAGGCGLALKLLFDGVVSKIYVNDLDPAIWAFWNAVLNQNDELCELIDSTPLTIEEWYSQRQIFAANSLKQSVNLGFAAFFLNRTNRSGIIKGAGVIGGLDQRGNYKIDCRFNRPELIKKIRRISLYKEQITLSNLDAVDFIEGFEAVNGQHSLLCIDPPYFNKGSSLYTNFYKTSDHAQLANRVLKVKTPWLITYDDAPEIRSLYDGCPAYRFGIKYSAQQKRLGTELLVHSNQITIPEFVSVNMEAA